MARTWFRHDANASSDDAITELVDLFGPAGEVVFWRLCELHCADDNGIKIRREDLRAQLRIRDSWNFDLDAWLKKAAYLKLIRLERPSGSRTNRVLITARSWTKKNPSFETREAAAERKRRSRAKSVAGTSQRSHGDVTARSRGTDVQRTKRRKKDLGFSSEDLERHLPSRAGDSAEPVVTTARGKANGEVEIDPKVYAGYPQAAITQHVEHKRAGEIDRTCPVCTQPPPEAT